MKFCEEDHAFIAFEDTTPECPACKALKQVQEADERLSEALCKIDELEFIISENQAK
jgi:hypothetical protein